MSNDRFIRFKPIKSTSEEMEDINLLEGQLILTTDRKELFLDISNQERVPITDIQKITEYEKAHVEQNKEKFYLIKDTCEFYYYDSNGIWRLLNGDFSREGIERLIDEKLVDYVTKEEIADLFSIKLITVGNLNSSSSCILPDTAQTILEDHKTSSYVLQGISVNDNNMYVYGTLVGGEIIENSGTTTIKLYGEFIIDPDNATFVTITAGEDSTNATLAWHHPYALRKYYDDTNINLGQSNTIGGDYNEVMGQGNTIGSGSTFSKIIGLGNTINSGQWNSIYGTNSSANGTNNFLNGVGNVVNGLANIVNGQGGGLVTGQGNMITYFGENTVNGDANLMGGQNNNVSGFANIVGGYSNTIDKISSSYSTSSHNFLNGVGNVVNGLANAVVGEYITVKGNMNLVGGMYTSNQNILFPGDESATTIDHITGNYNISAGMYSSISGNSNIYTGEQNKIKGDNNIVTGYENAIKGNGNIVMGLYGEGTATGNSNFINMGTYCTVENVEESILFLTTNSHIKNVTKSDISGWGNVVTNADVVTVKGNYLKCDNDSISHHNQTGYLLIGHYNEDNPATRNKNLFVIGGGKDENHRKDVFTVDKEGYVTCKVNDIDEKMTIYGTTYINYEFPEEGQDDTLYLQLQNHSSLDIKTTRGLPKEVSSASEISDWKETSTNSLVILEENIERMTIEFPDPKDYGYSEFIIFKVGSGNWRENLYAVLSGGFFSYEIYGEQDESLMGWIHDYDPETGEHTGNRFTNEFGNVTYDHGFSDTCVLHSTNGHDWYPAGYDRDQNFLDLNTDVKGHILYCSHDIYYDGGDHPSGEDIWYYKGGSIYDGEVTYKYNGNTSYVAIFNAELRAVDGLNYYLTTNNSARAFRYMKNSDEKLCYWVEFGQDILEDAPDNSCLFKTEKGSGVTPLFTDVYITNRSGEIDSSIGLELIYNTSVISNNVSTSTYTESDNTYNIYDGNTISSNGFYIWSEVTKTYNQITTGGGGTSYIAGNNIQINGNVISATDTTYTAGANITIDANNVISTTGGGGGGTSYTAGNGIDISGTTISAKIKTSDSGLVLDSSGLSVDTNVIQPLLTAGSNISINNGTISATDTTYSNGNGLNLSSGTFSIKTYSNSGITVDSNGVSVDTSTIQTKLTAGSNITINNGTISATDTTYTAGTGISITNGVISLNLAQAEGGGF